MIRALSALALALLLAVPTAGAAPPQPGPPPVYQPAPERTPAEKARDRDASIDRGFLMSHAENLGEGRWSINSYELFLLGVTYGVSDDFQLSVTTSLPVVEDMPLMLAFAGKWAFFRTPSTVMAARLLVAWESDLADTETTVGVVTGALFVDHYLDDEGRFALHGGLSVGGAFGSGFDSGGIQFADGALLGLELGFTAGIADSVKLYVEGQIPAYTADGEFLVGDVVFINYGVRFHGHTISGDVGFIRPVSSDVDDPFILGIPFVALSARFGGD